MPIVEHLGTRKSSVIQILFRVSLTNTFSSASINMSLLSLYLDNPLAKNMFQQSCPIRDVLYSTLNVNNEFITILYASDIKNPLSELSLMDPLRFIYNNVPII